MTTHYVKGQRSALLRLMMTFDDDFRQGSSF